jgi:nicotinate-nucleotide adenylyltransferase
LRIGILGGTFDPPHVGHLVMASEACEALGLERLLWIPSAEHPFKRGRVRTPAETRLALVRAAIQGDPRFEACDLELRREGPSYTVDTLRELTSLHPGAELVLLVGADVVREMPDWREPHEVARLARVAAITREGEGLPEGHSLPALPVPVTRVDVSASEIRRRVAAGQTIRYLVPEPVRALIEAAGLYRELHRW